jgi:hypothetical protein
VALDERASVKVRAVRVGDLVDLVGAGADEQLVVRVVPVERLHDGVQRPQVLQVEHDACHHPQSRTAVVTATASRRFSVDMHTSHHALPHLIRDTRARRMI